uniref:Protein kinase domain-containing protein n=1 Tax=Macrostomum lignano TaxID=282301 RepID=A0A1I8JR90_9PLAT
SATSAWQWRFEEAIFTVCGTPTYVAPEILSETGYGLEVDMWALGVIAYILLCGFPPFRSRDRRQSELFQMIKTGTFEYLSPTGTTCPPVTAKDLINRLLVVDKAARLTAIDVLCHAWVLSRGGSQRQEQEQQTDSAALKDEQSRLRDQLTAARFTPEQPDGPDFSPQSAEPAATPAGLSVAAAYSSALGQGFPAAARSAALYISAAHGFGGDQAAAAAYFAAHHGFGAARPDGCLVPLPSGNKKLRRLRKPRTIYSSLQLQQLSRFPAHPVPCHCLSGLSWQPAWGSRRLRWEQLRWRQEQ